METSAACALPVAFEAARLTLVVLPVRGAEPALLVARRPALGEGASTTALADFAACHCDFLLAAVAVPILRHCAPPMIGTASKC
jgi:hypothetical protein